MLENNNKTNYYTAQHFDKIFQKTKTTNSDDFQNEIISFPTQNPSIDNIFNMFDSPTKPSDTNERINTANNSQVYAVAIGGETGIFTDRASCHASTIAYSGNYFKKSNSMEEVVMSLKNRGVTTTHNIDDDSTTINTYNDAASFPTNKKNDNNLDEDSNSQQYDNASPTPQ